MRPDVQAIRDEAQAASARHVRALTSITNELTQEQIDAIAFTIETAFIEGANFSTQKLIQLLDIIKTN